MSILGPEYITFFAVCPLSNLKPWDYVHFIVNEQSIYI